MDESKITRLEVISKYGQQFVKHNCKIELSIQDKERTLKIFVK